ncbi:MAG: hypothetical protein JWO87_558 [Phycisphaerales bacterium]|nr:hypothetical protein [Phycisphaerales bacterium]
MASSDESRRARLAFLESEARTRPRRHALRLFAIVALGYLYPLFLLAASFGLILLVMAIAPLAWQSMSGEGMIVFGLALFALLLVAAAVLQTFWVRLPVPDGHPLRPDEAGPLRAMIEEERMAAGAPRVHHIHINAELNAAVAQRHRFQFWGPRTNYLIVGVPLLLALTSGQFRAVLAHEFGHLGRRHTSFGAWIYRIQHTWQSLAAPFARARRMRALGMGWFVKMYAPYLHTGTLALRRLHEYDADQRGPKSEGKEGTARALIAISWAGYRMGASFWPAVVRESAADPIPPADILGRIAQLFASAPRPEEVRCWRARERAARTPVTSEHPCLADRLEALGCRQVLDYESDDRLTDSLSASLAAENSAIGLLGDCRPRIWALANATWKATAIGRWRHENAVARGIMERLAIVPDGDPAQSSADREWEQIQYKARYAHPDEAVAILKDFRTRFCDHASSSFTLGRLLLDRDDEAVAVDEFETAMRHDSGYIAPSLYLLLEYYRESGRDQEADAIRVRLEAHERELALARKERLLVKRRDRFVPHGLSAEEAEKVRSIVHRYPQVRAAYLARKQVRLFSDKPSYVLAIRRRGRLMEDRKSSKRLTDCLHSQMEIPCAIAMLNKLPRGVRKRLIEACPAPLFDSAE